MNEMVMILIPANPNREYESGPNVGSIENHMQFLNERGKVFWRLVPPRANWKVRIRYNPKCGYFYSVIDKRVTHKFKIEQMLKGEDLPENLEQFVPSYREYHICSGFLILINSIILLQQPHYLSEFFKISDGTAVKRVQNFVWIQDINYK
ncbi:MAG: hypothetical protein ACTSVV_13665 [Promethearchaeota archaeon]